MNFAGRMSSTALRTPRPGCPRSFEIFAALRAGSRQCGTPGSRTRATGIIQSHPAGMRSQSATRHHGADVTYPCKQFRLTNSPAWAPRMSRRRATVTGEPGSRGMNVQHKCWRCPFADPGQASTLRSAGTLDATQT